MFFHRWSAPIFTVNLCSLALLCSLQIINNSNNDDQIKIDGMKPADVSARCSSRLNAAEEANLHPHRSLQGGGAERPAAGSESSTPRKPVPSQRGAINLDYARLRCLFITGDNALWAGEGAGPNLPTCRYFSGAALPRHRL